MASPPPTWEDIHRVNDELITVTDAAALSGVSAMTMYRWIKLGRHQAVAIGNGTFLRRSDIQAAS
jgi:excisionase family DNA binding protein